MLETWYCTVRREVNIRATLAPAFTVVGGKPVRDPDKRLAR